MDLINPHQWAFNKTCAESVPITEDTRHRVLKRQEGAFTEDMTHIIIIYTHYFI